MPTKRKRRYDRTPCEAVATISWTAEDGDTRFARGRCLDFSEVGLRIELPAVIREGSYVTLRIEAPGAGIDLAGSARVRHVRPRGPKSVLGLELGQKLRGRGLEALRALSTSVVEPSISAQ